MNVRTVRALALGAVSLVGVLGGGACGPGLGTTTTEPKSCRDVSGDYRASFITSCSKSGTDIAATVTQSGCTFVTDVKGLGRLVGTIGKDKNVSTLAFESPCAGEATGPVTLGTARIDVTFAGTQSATCCTIVHGQVSLYR